jgi:hypothetical protein
MRAPAGAQANNKPENPKHEGTTANSNQQTAISKQQSANSKQQTANSKQQTANSKQQNSKQQTAKQPGTTCKAQMKPPRPLTPWTGTPW